MIEQIQLPGKSFIVVFLFTFFFLSLSAQDTITVSSRKSGTASFYNKKFNGRKTSSGERLDNNRFTAAHSSIPFGTMVRVTNQANGKSVVVKINDRFYPRKGHLIDVTYAAAKEIDMIRQGIARVTLEVLEITETEAEAEAIIPPDTITYRMPAKSMSLPLARFNYEKLKKLHL